MPPSPPKVLTTDAVQASDAVITMGRGDACPVFPGKRYPDWKLEDPDRLRELATEWPTDYVLVEMFPEAAGRRRPPLGRS